MLPAQSPFAAMSLYPKTAIDLALAPVAAHVDMNLAAFRDSSPDELVFHLELKLNCPEIQHTVEERAARVLEASVRNVGLHGWHAAISDDHCRLRLSGGSVSLDLGLSAAIMRYIETGK